MNLLPPVGHEALRGMLGRAQARGRLPQVLHLHGPPGVGKQRMGLWIGQLLLCTEPSVEGPCGGCRDCSLALRLEHPELHWFLPLPKPKGASSPDREEELLEDARIRWLEEARLNPLRITHNTEVRGLHMGTIRNLRKRAAVGVGPRGRRLFLIGNAEELGAQEASSGAANALLKLLEEPPMGSWFVLTSAEPGRVVDTIRSRSTELHLPSLPPAPVADFLVAHAGATPEAAERASVLSGGSIGRALGFLPEKGEEGPMDAVRRDALVLVRAALHPDDSKVYQEALSVGPTGARGLTETLALVELWLRDLAAAASGVESAIQNRDAAEWLMRRVEERRIHPAGPSRALAAVEESREAALGNVNPQLLIANLIFGIRRELFPGS